MAHAFEIFLLSNNVTHIESLMNIKAALLKICRKLYSGSTWKSSPTHTLGVNSFNLWNQAIIIHPNSFIDLLSKVMTCEVDMFNDISTTRWLHFTVKGLN